eukprot:3442051-Rhodomonas_salina.1
MNALGNAGLRVLCSTEGLSKCAALACLNLSDNEIGGAGLICLAEALAVSGQRLKKLTLTGNQISAGAGVSVAKILQSCCLLEDLDLSFNILGNDEMRPISAALSHARCLKQLNLSWNHIHAAGAKPLAQGLALCASLECILVERNALGFEGARWVVEAMSNCKSVHTFCAWTSKGAKGTLFCEGIPEGSTWSELVHVRRKPARRSIPTASTRRRASQESGKVLPRVLVCGPARIRVLARGFALLLHLFAGACSVQDLPALLLTPRHTLPSHAGKPLRQPTTTSTIATANIQTTAPAHQPRPPLIAELIQLLFPRLALRAVLLVR